MLLGAYPEKVLQKKDDEGNLPLHLAIQYGLSLEVVKALVEAYPDGVTVKNNYNRVALHELVFLDEDDSEFPRDYVDVEVLKFMLEVHPEGSKNTDNLGNLPLHSSIKFDLSLEIIRILILVYPESLLVQNKYGNLPLHKAADYGRDVEINVLSLDGNVPAECYSAKYQWELATSSCSFK